MADTTKLKKGTPPQRLQEQKKILEDTRAEEGKNRPLQLMIPQVIFEEFSATAGQKFGFEKGAKSRLFREIWQFYQSQLNMKK
jgi:hypothetical protein